LVSSGVVAKYGKGLDAIVEECVINCLGRACDDLTPQIVKVCATVITAGTSVGALILGGAYETVFIAIILSIVANGGEARASSIRFQKAIAIFGQGACEICGSDKCNVHGEELKIIDVHRVIECIDSGLMGDLLNLGDTATSGN